MPVTAVHGNCINKLKPFAKQEEELKPRLAVADPPYNIGQTYADYDDDQTIDEYLEQSNEWMQATFNALHKHGSMIWFAHDSLVSEVDVAAKKIGFKKRGHIIWYYTFGVNSTKSFTPSHTHLLYYTKNRAAFTFNSEDPALRIPSARQLKYNDKRANSKGRLPDNTWILFPEQLQNGFPPGEDTWLFSRVCGTFHARKRHSPNQLPLALVERCVLFLSNPGDLVIDPFLGTGTTADAAMKHGRDFWGCDVSRECVDQFLARLGKDASDVRTDGRTAASTTSDKAGPRNSGAGRKGGNGKGGVRRGKSQGARAKA